ncbi:hypothetical protein B9Z55_004939 [Caenorhabditis nigoni]|uniref:Uncharacterized protein n=1 Tax=Caenorhabditis nigoni TaxID=1611254 RepID=A0A2G5UYN2_9PELO|nr:hypothetical protein B9Z55_004939 [Caenorhabditis nigoni]
MLFPSLFQLTAKSVAQEIHNGKFPFDFNLDSKSNNAVVRELLKLDPKNIEKLKTYKYQLSRLTELDLSKCQIDEEGILNLKNFTLNSLEFGDLYHLKMKFPHPIYIYGVDIVSLLERALNTNSRKMMVHLGFSGEEELFMFGWEEKISELFPSLQSLKIISKRFNERCPFSSFCNLFPNLRVLDISYARDLSTLNGIKNLRNLQKLVMRNAGIGNIDGYKELSELTNLSGPYRSNDSIRVIGSLLAAEVRMQNLEFLDCSRTSVDDHELRKFLEHHPKLQTVVAISTRCCDSYMPTINLLNFLTTDSTLKSLEYALTNGRDQLAQNCMMVIIYRIEHIDEQLNDYEMNKLLKTFCYVLREAKTERIRLAAIRCFTESSFFKTERFSTLLSLKIRGIVELIFKQIIELLIMGKTLQRRHLNFIIEKTVELSCQYSGHFRKGAFILIEANRFMGVDQYKVMGNNKKVVKGLFKIAHALFKTETLLYHQIIELIVRYLSEAAEDTLRYLVSDCESVEKCYEQFMIIMFLSPAKGSLKNLSQIVLELTTVINPNDPEEKTKAIMACSVLSILLAKNLVKKREYVNTLLEEFNDSWGRSNILDGQYTTYVLNAIFTSEYSTDASIRFGLILMTTFIHAKGCTSKEYWNWMRETSAGIRNNEKWKKNTRQSASSVLYEMRMVNMK